MPELVGFAVLPADTFADGPPSGNFIESQNRETPFDSQPVQGFSGVQFAPDSEDGSIFWFLSDNGFGSQGNSADYLLRLYQLDPDFAGTEDGNTSVDIQGFIQLADPNNLIPFDIVNEDTSDRFLTGADFDIESFVIDNDGDIWIGEEFGPYILHFDNTGTLLEAPIATPNPIELNTLNGQDPLVIAHRGASGDLPEHTLEAYEAAIAAGADFIEPDLVPTSDGVLIARHENALATVELDENGNIIFDADGNPILTSSGITTNVADLPQFADRLTVKEIDGDLIGGWFSEDFTWEEIDENLVARERIPGTRPSNTAFNDQFKIPRLEQVIELVNEVEAETGVEIGIYPETKHPTFFADEGTFLDGTTSININISQILVETLLAEEFTDPNRIFIQSFEFSNLIEIQELLNNAGAGDIPLVQLYGNTTAGANPNSSFSFPYDIRFNVAEGNNLAAIYGQEFLDAAEVPLSENTVYADLDSAEFLEVIGELYAEGAGPWKNNILLRESLETDVDGDGDGEAEIDDQLTGEITSFIEDAHDAGLQVHPYTLRDEERFLTLNPNNTEEFDAPQLIVSALIGIERPGGNATLYSRIDPTQTEEQGNNVEPFFDFTFSPADLVLDSDTGIVTTPTIPFFIAPEFAEEIGKPELAGVEAGFFIDNFALELNEGTGEFVIVGGSDSGSFNSIFVSEDFLNDNDLEIIQGSGIVDPIETDVDTTGFVGFGFPLSENADVRFITDPDTGLLIPLGGAYVAEGSISFEVLGTGTPQTAEEEFEQLIDIGADGFFTDFARTGVPVRDAIVADEVRAPQNPNLNNFNTLDGSAPIVIGHRGASGQFPEHTLEAYRLAIVQGADFVEPDLVITSDGVLIARHEPLLDDTTNVAEVFGPERQSSKILDGEEKTGYFAEDFTLAEIKQLRAVQSRDFRDQSFNGEFEIPTFQEVIELVQEMEDFGFEVGIYPETKHPTFFDEQNLSLEEPLIQTLQNTGFTDPNRIFIQSFEVQNLLELRNEILPAQGLENLKLVQLLGDTEDEFINEGGGGFSVPFDFVANSEQLEPIDIDALANQVNYATFTGSAFTVTLLAEKNPGPGAPQEILDQFGNLQDTNQFILQDATNPDNTVVLFAGPDSAPKSIEVTISETGVVAINGDEVANNFSQQVHFGLINSLPIGDPTGLGAESYTFSTNNALNPESDPQFAIYSEVENEFIIAAEELPFANSNQDFDDMIVKVSGIESVGETQADISFNPERLQPLLETANTRAIYGNLADLIDFSSVPTYADLANPEVIELIGAYADGLGPWKNSFLLRDDIETSVDGDGDGNAEITTQLTGEVLPLIDWGHDTGLQVHPYTLRNEERDLTLNPDGTPQTPGEEFEQLIEIGADGFFTDFPATGSIVVEQFIDEPNIRTSRGYEGMAFSPDRETFYPLLEGAVDGDPNNALRIYEFDPASSSFTNLLGFYPTDVPGHAIGDFTPINETEFLVIERDGRQGDEAQFKKIFKVDLSVVDDEGFVFKEEVVDLLNIDDPNDLNGDGDTNFSFPFFTIEDVLVIDEDTILVANDNNYPFSMGRPPEIDNNEIIQIELDETLNLAPGIGVPLPLVSIDVEPDTVDETGDLYFLTFNLNVPAPEGGLRVVWSETDSDNELGDISFPPELTNASNLESLDPVDDEIGRSAITIDEGATTATVTWTTIFDGEEEGDETTTIELQPEDGYVVDAENQVAQIVIEDTDSPPGQLITGTAQGEVLPGGNGDDTIIGFNGADTLAGSFGDDSIIGSRGSDILRGQDGEDTLQGRQGNDRLVGGDGDDVLNGGQGRDRMNGGAGNDILNGGGSIDFFIFNSNEEFDPDDFGVDTINNFQPDLRPDEDGNQGDRIILDRSTFTELDSAAGIGFSVNSDFAIVADDDDVDSSSAFIVYSEESGGVFYNVDGESTRFATLDGAPTITEDNFQIR